MEWVSRSAEVWQLSTNKITKIMCIKSTQIFCRVFLKDLPKSCLSIVRFASFLKSYNTIISHPGINIFLRFFSFMLPQLSLDFFFWVLFWQGLSGILLTVCLNSIRSSMCWQVQSSIPVVCPVSMIVEDLRACIFYINLTSGHIFFQTLFFLYTKFLT